METSIELSDDDKPRRDDKVPLIVHLTADQVNQMQQEANANYRFSQNVYVNLNSAYDFHAFTRLTAFLVFLLI